MRRTTQGAGFPDGTESTLTVGLVSPTVVSSIVTKLTSCVHSTWFTTTYEWLVLRFHSGGGDGWMVCGRVDRPSPFKTYPFLILLLVNDRGLVNDFQTNLFINLFVSSLSNNNIIT